MHSTHNTLKQTETRNPLLSSSVDGGQQPGAVAVGGGADGEGAQEVRGPPNGSDQGDKGQRRMVLGSPRAHAGPQQRLKFAESGEAQVLLMRRSFLRLKSFSHRFRASQERNLPQFHFRTKHQSINLSSLRSPPSFFFLTPTTSQPQAHISDHRLRWRESRFSSCYGGAFSVASATFDVVRRKRGFGRFSDV